MSSLRAHMGEVGAVHQDRSAAAARELALDFDSFYESHYGDMVAMACALTGDLTVAEDLAQEAFSRAWQRWDTVTDYEDPAAWVRRVVANLATSRWRRLRVARRYLARARPVHVPGVDPAHVAVVAALRTLPSNHARALVLHHMVDLSVSEVAREMGVAVGTVKSWLHRGRAALAAKLGEPDPKPDRKEVAS